MRQPTVRFKVHVKFEPLAADPNFLGDLEALVARLTAAAIMVEAGLSQVVNDECLAARGKGRSVKPKRRALDGTAQRRKPSNVQAGDSS